MAHQEPLEPVVGQGYHTRGAAWLLLHVGQRQKLTPGASAALLAELVHELLVTSARTVFTTQRAILVGEEPLGDAPILDKRHLGDINATKGLRSSAAAPQGTEQRAVPIVARQCVGSRSRAGGP